MDRYTSGARRNLHLPLDQRTYAALKARALRERRPATQLVREAIGRWIEERDREEAEQAMAAYVGQVAGSADDLDVELEQAAVESLLSETGPRKRRGR